MAPPAAPIAGMACAAALKKYLYSKVIWLNTAFNLSLHDNNQRI